MALTDNNILKTRLQNQLIVNSICTTPEEVVHKLGAMQAQEYSLAKWAIGLRLPGSTDDIIEKAFNDGRILRTHILRPTWHFVSPEDIHFIQAATSHRVHAFTRHYAGKLELDNKILNKSIDVLSRSLEGENYLTRKLLQEELAQHKIIAAGQRLALILIHAELECIICSGPRIGKQFTYAVIDERVKGKSILNKEEAIAKLASVYFNTRGPATIKDFCWWSSLTIKEAKAGIAECGDNLVCEEYNGKEYLYIPAKLVSVKKNVSEATFIMPDYDEYGISYADRDILFSLYNEGKKKKVNPGRVINDAVFIHTFIVNGIAAGTWNSKITKGETKVDVTFFRGLGSREEKDVKKAINKFVKFFS